MLEIPKRCCQLSHSEQGRKWNPPEKQIWSKMGLAVCREIHYLHIYCWVRGVCQILGKQFKVWVWVPFGFWESLRPDGINTFVTAGGSWWQLTNCELLPGCMMSTFVVQGPQTRCRHSPTSAKHHCCCQHTWWLNILSGVWNTHACSVLWQHEITRNSVPTHLVPISSSWGFHKTGRAWAWQSERGQHRWKILARSSCASSENTFSGALNNSISASSVSLNPRGHSWPLFGQACPSSPAACRAHSPSVLAGRVSELLGHPL